MLKCSKTLKIALLLAGVYAAFMAVMLVEVSSAKYQETRLAYTNFGAASFNTVILNKTTAGGYAAFNVFEDPVQASQVSGYRPGMKKQQIPFTVANGVDATNASDASIEYEICLRTTGHLPLKYTLIYNGTNYRAKRGDPIPADENKTTWYETRFYPEEGEKPITFELQGGTTGGKPNAKDYQLVVEWPVVSDGKGGYTNDSKYMKEVDLLELFVNVSSKNMLDAPAVTIQVEPGMGILILDPAKGGRVVHTLDFRAFTEGATGETYYDFVIENGVGKNIVHTQAFTDYTFEIEVPYTPKTKNFSYTLKNEAGQSVTMTQPDDIGYRLYDVLYGKGAVQQTFGKNYAFSDAEVEGWAASDSQYELYKVYRVSVSQTLENTAHDADVYRLMLTGAGSSTIQEIAFANKIDIIVTAAERGSELANEHTVEGGDAGA